MLIQYLSDLHLEFPANQHWLDKNPIPPEGEVLIVAGDTHPLGNSFERLRVWDYFSQHFRETYVLPGNHEYYGGYDVAMSLSETKRPIKKNVWLVNNCVVEKPEVRLVFTTLWSRIEKNIAGVLLGMRDFKRIRYQGKLIGIDHYNGLHEVALEFLTNNLTANPQKPQIVVSHHLPSERCNATEFQGSALNEAFCVDLTDFVAQSGVDAWIYGHSHRNVEAFTIGRTQMLTNQLGYVQLGEHATFRENAGIVLSD